MQITIDDLEIKKAITNYIKGEGINTDDMEISVELTAGRNGNGHKAAITISADSTNSTKTKKTRNKKITPILSMEKQTEEASVTPLETQSDGTDETAVEENKVKDVEIESSTAESLGTNSLFNQK